LEDKDQALFWLEKTYEERSGMWILVWAKQFAFFDSLRAEPRFKELLKKARAGEIVVQGRLAVNLEAMMLLFLQFRLLMTTHRKLAAILCDSYR